MHWHSQGTNAQWEDLFLERELAIEIIRAEGPRGEDAASMLAKFFQMLPARIAYWANARDDHHQGPAPKHIDLYLERLHWIAAIADDESFLGQPGDVRFSVVADALRYGVHSAVLMLRAYDTQVPNYGPLSSDRELAAAYYGKKETDAELAYLIHQQRGTAVEFRPLSNNNSPQSPRGLASVPSRASKGAHLRDQRH